MPIIDKKTVEHLAELARVELKDEEKEKLARDLEKILKHFEELKEVDTGGVRPMDGGTFEENVFRADSAAQMNADQNADKCRYSIGENLRGNLRESALVKQFPEKKDGFLKVPAVFGNENLESGI